LLTVRVRTPCIFAGPPPARDRDFFRRKAATGRKPGAAARAARTGVYPEADKPSPTHRRIDGRPVSRLRLLMRHAHPGEAPDRHVEPCMRREREKSREEGGGERA
jgi:hypothetical protein